jgi:hypothetical protein
MWIVQEIANVSEITLLFDTVSANWKGLRHLRMLLHESGEDPI